MKRILGLLFVLLLMAMLSGVAMAGGTDKGSSIAPSSAASFDAVAVMDTGIVAGSAEWPDDPDGDKCSYSEDAEFDISTNTGHDPTRDYLPDIS